MTASARLDLQRAIHEKPIAWILGLLCAVSAAVVLLLAAHAWLKDPIAAAIHAPAKTVAVVAHKASAATSALSATTTRAAKSAPAKPAH